MNILHITISDGQAGQRLDNFLLKLFRVVPKSRVYKAIRKAEVRVNKHRVQATYRLLVGDLVRCPELYDRAAKDAARPVISESMLARVKACVLYQDEQLMVLHKPAGLAVHGGTHTPHGLINSLRQAFPDYPFLELAHRLDRETSGCLLIAKQRAALLALQEGFRERQIKKMYFSVLKGRLTDNNYHVDLPLAVSSHNEHRQKTTAAADGKPAVTGFKVLARGPEVTLVAAYPQTGRTHQIRAHAAAIGHPVLGDDRYGDRAFNKMQRTTWGDRLYLHAASYELDMIDHLDLLGICVPVDDAWKDKLQIAF